jgi:hypothetical protein
VPRTRGTAGRGGLQVSLQFDGGFSAIQSEIARGRSGDRDPFRPIPSLPFRTHVPRADDPPIEQTLAPRAGARCRGNGTRVRDAGRGNARSRSGVGGGSPAAVGRPSASDRPHRRPPAPPAHRSSATQAPERHGPPARAGLPHAGTSPGEQAGLTARRRPVWEDGSAGRPGALPRAPVFIASRAALHGRLECGGAPLVCATHGPGAGAKARGGSVRTGHAHARGGPSPRHRGLCGSGRATRLPVRLDCHAPGTCGDGRATRLPVRLECRATAGFAAAVGPRACRCGSSAARPRALRRRSGHARARRGWSAAPARAWPQRRATRSRGASGYAGGSCGWHRALVRRAAALLRGGGSRSSALQRHGASSPWVHARSVIAIGHARRPSGSGRHGRGSSRPTQRCGG